MTLEYHDWGSVRLLETSHEPAQQISWHQHEHACITYVYSGGYHESYRRRDVDCTNHGLLLKPAGIEHKDSYSPKGASSVVMILDRDENNDLLEFIRDVSYLDHAEAGSLGVRLLQELRHPDECTALVVDGLLRSIIAMAHRLGSVDDRSTQLPWLDRVRDKLHTSHSHQICLQQIARQEGVHPDHLTRAFKRSYGLLPGEYVRQMRLEAVRHTLAKSQESLSSIALECGYADQSHMTRAFHRQYGEPPGRYRKRIQNN